MRMKAVLCERPGTLRVVDRPTPVRQAGELLLHIRRVGLCGTDYHIVRGEQPFLNYPRIPGHELAGIVADADAGSSFRPGDRVTVNPYLPCGHCVACRKGKPNCCVAVSVFGVHADGGMCEYLAVPEAAAIAVGDLDLDDAAMVEFLAIGAHAVRRGEIRARDQVLVVGAGPIGVAVALFARRAGASVLIADSSAARLARARDAAGLADVILADAELGEALSRRTGGDYFDVVFDATGSAAAIERGFSWVAHGGSYVLVSVVKQDICFADPEFHKREMRLIGSRNATADDFRTVIEAIRSGDIPTRAMRTHRFALADAPARILDLIDDPGAVLKAIVTI